MSKPVSDKYVDTSKLPKKYGFGANSNKLVIDWNKITEGIIIPFKFGNITGEFITISFNKDTRKIKLKYKEDEFELLCSSLVNCKIGTCVGVYNRDFLYEIGDNFKDNKRDITIIDKIKDNGKYYIYHCNKCDNEDKISESHLKGGNGCNACCFNHQKIIIGVNDMATTAPWMIKYLVNPEDGYKYTCRSTVVLPMKCPYCGGERGYKPDVLFNHKIFPCTCSNNSYYPEKFVFKLLNQLNINFIWQVNKSNINWDIGQKRYDFYFKFDNKEYIIEVHGGQHYKYQGRGRSIKEEKENDEFKYNLAIQNGIKPENYIVLDCRKSELEWIKNSILNSKLNEIFDLNNIDWKECEKYALEGLTKQICEYWEEQKKVNKNVTIQILIDKFKLSRKTILKHLKKGIKMGWCEYDKKEEMEIEKRQEYKPIKVIEKDGEELVFNNRYLMIDYYSEKGIALTLIGIYKVTKGYRKTYKGLKFEYIDK